MNVKTIKSDQVWESPDGQKKLWEVTLEVEGKEYRLKTFSPKISQIGYEGDVESYTNNRGERLVKQVPKPGGYGGGGKRDDDAIRAQWAIGQAINLASVKMDKEAITLPVIERYAKELYETVSRVKGSN